MGIASRIPAALLERAANRCKYCHFPTNVAELPFEIDPIIAKQHGGMNAPENLAVACFYCNSYKGPNIAGIDPQSGEIIRLFNPRVDLWSDHFRWLGAVLVGLTAIARATIQVLAMNHPDAIAVRESLLRERPH